MQSKLAPVRRSLLRSFYACFAATLVLTRPTVAAGNEEVLYLQSSPAPLVGTLTEPSRFHRGPAFLLLGGSGPVDRNGSIPSAGYRPDTLRLLANALAQAGYTSLRADKRCVGASGAACPGETSLTINTYADDAAGWARMLSKRPGVTCVVIVGHSEGALIGAMAAISAPACGFISVAGIGRPFRQVVEEQIENSGAGSDLLAQVKLIDDQLAQGRPVSDVPPALAPLYRPSVQPYLISEMRVDPTKLVASLKCPVLILQGTEDRQVNIIDAQRLVAANSSAEIVLLTGVNHSLKASSSKSGTNSSEIEPVPLARGVTDRVVHFVENEVSRRERKC